MPDKDATQNDQMLDATFVNSLLETFVSLAQGNFQVRLPRNGLRDTQDSIAYLVNLMAEEVGELLLLRERNLESTEAFIASVTDVLVKIGSGEFDARVTRSFDGRAEDVLAYLVNTAAEELQDLFRQLEQKNAILEDQANRQAIADRAAFSTLSAGVGHELNNPLSFAAGNLDFLRIELQQLQVDGTLDRIPELLDAISDAKEGIARAARIAADLKQLTPAVEMSFSPSNPAELVESALALTRNSVKHRAQLICTYADDLPPIMADRGRLGQVMVNLIQNALHALPPDRPVKNNRIEVTTYRHSERMVAIEVCDNGEGISPDDLSRIFDSFYTTRPVGQGTGLGLALSKRMISDHGGRIEVESAPGEGATFRVLLPVAQQPR